MVGCNWNLAFQAFICFCNYVAPCTIPSAVQEQQMALTNTVLHAGPNNIGLVMMPAFSYKAGQLYLIEHQIIKSLSMRSIHMDTSFSLVYERRSDARDNRPCNLQGRIAHSNTFEMRKSGWRNCPLMTVGRTEPAKQVPNKQLIMVEDLSEESLPSADSERVQGGRRFEQLGEDAAMKLLQATIDTVDFGERTMLVLVDVSPGVGNMMTAFVKLKGNRPMYYFAACESDVHQAWLHETTLSIMQEDFVAGRLTIPGITPAAVTPPDGVIESQPPRPDLQLLVWMADVPNIPGCPQGVKFPVELLNKWNKHPRFAEPFQTFYDEVRAYCGEEVEDTSHQVPE